MQGRPMNCLYVTKQLQIDFDIGYLLFKHVHQQIFVSK